MALVVGGMGGLQGRESWDSWMRGIVWWCWCCRGGACGCMMYRSKVGATVAIEDDSMIPGVSICA